MNYRNRRTGHQVHYQPTTPQQKQLTLPQGQHRYPAAKNSTRSRAHFLYPSALRSSIFLLNPRTTLGKGKGRKGGGL